MSFLLKTTTTTSPTTTLIKRIIASSPFITSTTTTSRKTMSALSRAGLPHLVGAATTTPKNNARVVVVGSPSINRFNNNTARGDRVRTYAFGARKAPKGQLPEREPTMGLDPENAQAKVQRRHFCICVRFQIRSFFSFFPGRDIFFELLRFFFFLSRSRAMTIDVDDTSHSR